MSQEINLTASLSAFKQAVMSQTVGRAITAPFNMTGTAYSEGVLTVQTYKTRVPTGQITQPHWAYFKNNDATNYVLLYWGYTALYFARLYPGEAVFIPLPDDQILPATAATVAAAGGGNTGGSLGAGTYVLWYTNVTNGGWESTVGLSQSASFTVVTGAIPQVTLPALGSGVLSYNLYVSDTTQANPRLYASDITTTTYDLSAALPSISGTNPPPPSENYNGVFAQAYAPVSLEYLILSA